MKRYRISFVGAGRVAGALSQAFYEAGSDILKIVARTEESSMTLASRYNALSGTDPVFPVTADVIVLAVPDDKIKDLLSVIKCGKDAVVAHTAGSVGLDVFPAHLRHTGVIYPLQTFSHGRKLNFRDVPFFLEASDPKAESAITDLVNSISGKVHYTDTSHRRLLHLAAVFACNFTNHMLTAGNIIAKEAGEDFGILEPLIRETISKAVETGPESSQTGPAVRFDTGTMEKHMEMLSFSPGLKRIYREISDSVMDYYKTKENDQF